MVLGQGHDRLVVGPVVDHGGLRHVPPAEALRQRLLQVAARHDDERRPPAGALVLRHHRLVDQRVARVVHGHGLLGVEVLDAVHERGPQPLRSVRAQHPAQNRRLGVREHEVEAPAQLTGCLPRLRPEIDDVQHAGRLVALRVLAHRHAHDPHTAVLLVVEALLPVLLGNGACVAGNRAHHGDVEAVGQVLEQLGVYLGGRGDLRVVVDRVREDPLPAHRRTTPFLRMMLPYRAVSPVWTTA